MAEPEANPAYDSAAAEELAEVTAAEEELAEVTERGALRRMYHRVIAAMSKLDATAGGGTTDSGGLVTLARHVDGWHDHLATLAEEGPPEARDSFMAYTKASRARSQLQMQELKIMQMQEMMMKKMMKMQLQMMQLQLEGASIESSTWDMYEQQMQQMRRMRAPE